MIIDYGIQFIKENSQLTTLITKYEKISIPSKNIIKQMEALSVYWELSSILIPSVYIMSNKNIDHKQLVKEGSSKIYSFFKPFGLTSQYKEKFRLIRNANSHTIELSKDANCIVYEGKKISLQEVTWIYLKIAKIFRWNSKLLITTCYKYPKIGFLFLYGVIYEIKNHEDIYSDYMKALENLVPNIFKNTTKTKMKDLNINIEPESSFILKKAYVNTKNLISKIIYRRQQENLATLFIAMLLHLFIYLLDKLEEFLYQLNSEISTKVNDAHLKDFEQLRIWIEKNKESINAQIRSLITEIK